MACSIRYDGYQEGTLAHELCKLGDAKAQELGNALYGVGQLGAVGVLRGAIDTGVLSSCLSALCQLGDVAAQGLGNADPSSKEAPL